MSKKPDTWKVLDLTESEDGREVYCGTSEQEARNEAAKMIVAGVACRLLVSATMGSKAMRIVFSLPALGQTRT